MAHNLALTVLSATLGILFIFLGLIKLTPSVSQDMHKEMKTIFKNSNKVFPFYRQTGWKPKTSQYRRTFGTAELVCGLILAIIPGRLKTIANILLLSLMVLNIYSSWALSQDLKYMTGPLVFGLLLTCRLAIQMQTYQQNRVDLEAKQK